MLNAPCSSFRFPRTLLLALLALVFTASPVLAAGSFVDLAAQAGPAVVNISTETTVEAPQGMSDFFRFHAPFREFFEKFDEYFKQPEEQPGRPYKEQSSGSGFIISEDGYIVTNDHVAGEADVVRVNLQGHNSESESFTATVVGRDKETDLALLKIETDQKLPVLRFGDSDAMRVGEWVMAIGNPFGLDHSVTVGIVSAKGRVIGSGPYDDFIQTDAGINPGNSGGPLLNLKGEVIGINTAIIAAGQGIGFAIPSRQAQKVIAQLKEGKKVSRGWLGVAIQDVDENSAKALGLERASGALVAKVFEGHPADQAGLKVGDVIVTVDGEPVVDSAALLRLIAAIPPGEKGVFGVWRRGKVLDLTVTLGERDLEKLEEANGEQEPPLEEAAPETTGGADPQEVLGLSLRPVGSEDVEIYGLEARAGLLVVQLAPDSLAAENGVLAEDVILEANMAPVNSLQELGRILDEAAAGKGVVMLLLRREGRNLFRTVPLP